jgi:tryptophan synthase beta chain
MSEKRKVHLDDHEMPKFWYNIVADMPNKPYPVLHPGTGKPVSPADLAPIFPMEILKQEMSAEKMIEIPKPVREILKMWRPSPLYRAIHLERLLDTPAHIYYKYEGVSPAGSHKPNTAIAQAFYNKEQGVKRIATETGAGQWGSALSFAGSLFGIEIKVYMVRVSYDQKPYRKLMMQTWGGTVVPSPSPDTAAGRAMLAKDPDCPGSLGLAISEAVEDAMSREDTKYSLGSVLNHVCLHQTVIGQEAILQMEKFGEMPDVVIGCHGGGSNFAGIAFPFVGKKIKEGMKVRCVAVEPDSCPTLTKGVFAFDYGDVAHMAPIVKMYTLGAEFMPPGIHAGGLRYHGASPLVSQLLNEGFIEAKSLPQLACFDAAVKFARTEGIIPAPESSHAIRAAIDEALDAKKKGEKRVILFNLSGHGHFDLVSYDKYLTGQLKDFAMPKEEIAAALKDLPKVSV